MGVFVKISIQHIFFKSIPQVKFYQNGPKILQVESTILYFLLLILRIALNLCSNVGHKQSRFFKVLLKKSFEFIPNKRSNAITFYIDLILLPAEIDLLSKKQSHKKDTLVAHSTSHIKIILVMLTKVIVFYMQVAIV